MGNVSQGFGDVRGLMRQGLVGDRSRISHLDRMGFGLNQSPQAKEVWTATISDPGDDTDVTITINGVDITINTGTGLDASGVAAALVAGINAEPLVRGQVVASNVTTTLTLTGTIAGVAFTASESDGAIASLAQATAAASAEAVPFGRFVITQGRQSGYSDEIVALAKSSLFTAQVKTITVTYVASAVLVCNVYEVRNGEKELIGNAAVTSATDRDTTLDALIAAINADLPANSVIVTADNASATALIFTAEVAGLEFEAEILHVGGGASAPAITPADTTGPSESTSFHRAVRGISGYSPRDPAATVGGTTGQYAANAGVCYWGRASVWMDCDETPTAGSPVYVELGVSADNGKAFAADSATRIRVARDLARWLADGLVSTDSLGELFVSAP